MGGLGGRWIAAPLARVLLAQGAGALGAVIAAFGLAAWFGIQIPLFFAAAAAGAIAAWLGDRVLRLPRWWIPAQMAMLPGSFFIASFQLPSWIYLAAFALVLAVYWNAVRGRVPLYLTNETTRLALAALVPPRAGLKVLDLGHGLGGTVLALARARPDVTVEGIESAPLPYAVSWLRGLARAPANARLLYGNFWRRSLRPYDVVYAFLSPVPMQALYAKAKVEMAPGSMLISNSFPVPAHAADEVKILADRRGTRLFVYRM
jgi:hypothetical protein